MLVPYPTTKNQPRVADYDVYDAPESEAIEDKPRNAVVAGESQYKLLSRVKHALPICWWLSIDYSYLYNSARRSFAKPYEQKMPRGFLRAQASRARGTLRNLTAADQRFSHLTQSQYAWSYLVDRKRSLPSMLSDYTPRLESIRRTAGDGRAGIAYNATKAEYVTSQVASYMPDVEFIPIIGMTQDEVYQTLQRTQLYLDLGSHPGKDRIPREAAIAGNVVVVGLRGAGAYSADVPIPFAHKLLMEGNFQLEAAQQLDLLLDSIPQAFALQSQYRNLIAQERQVFDHEVKSFFIDGLRGFDSGHRPDLEIQTTSQQLPGR